MSQNRSKRQTSILAVIGVALLAAAILGFFGYVYRLDGSERVENVRRYQATATFNSQGNATIDETIDYYFPNARHGIVRIIGDLPFHGTANFSYASDAADKASEQATDDGKGTTIRLGDPAVTVTGEHWYNLTYHLKTLDFGGGKFGWDGVGTGWNVPTESVELDMVAPWKWLDAKCNVGAGGSKSHGTTVPCTVAQPEPGHLTVSYPVEIPAGQGLTVFAQKGNALAAAPKARNIPPYIEPESPFVDRIALAIAALIAAGLLSALIVFRFLRHAGRDWIGADALTSGAAAAAFSGGSESQTNAQLVRVDDEKLRELSTIAFAPPTNMPAWMGGMLADEEYLDRHRVAWFLDSIEQGYADLDDSNPDRNVLTRSEHAPDATTELFDMAFAGRNQIILGKPDEHFPEMWEAVPQMLKDQYIAANLTDPHSADLPEKAWLIGWAVLLVGLVPLYFAGTRAAHDGPIGVILAAVAGALVLGGFALRTRAWELRRHTPEGSARWLQIESFRKFLVNSEAPRITDAAQRGMLRQYSAWAVALGETLAWTNAVRAVNLPESTVGLSTLHQLDAFDALLAASATKQIKFDPNSASQTDQSSSSSLTSPSSGFDTGGGYDSGVGGGGGGGGGGSW